MAEVIIPVGYGNASLQWQTTTKPGLITVTLGYSTVGTFIDAEANANAIMTAATSDTPADSIAAPDQMTTAWQFSGVTVYERRVAGPLMRGDSTLSPVVGTQTSGSAEMVVSAPLRVTKRTQYVGRSYRGRCYAPVTAVEGEVNAAGELDSAFRIASQVAWNRFLANLVASDIDVFLLHADVDIDPTPITSFEVQPFVGTQRRRLARA